MTNREAATPTDTPQILTINPGSTSTKVAVFRGEAEVFASTVSHPAEELARFASIMDQEEFRFAAVSAEVDRARQDPGNRITERHDAVIGRGGLLRPLESGVYRVDEQMKADLRSGTYGLHASNLGAILADRFARDASLASEEAPVPAYIADPVVVDELDRPARYSGIPEIERRSIFHALNHKSAAREVADRLEMPYEELNLIVAHMGGGVSVGAHRKGRVVDVNNALDGDGPFSPERAGTLPAGQLVSLARSATYDEATIRRRLTGRGGLVAYLGTNSLAEVQARIAAGDEEAEAVFEAMVYQIAQEIARHGATLLGWVDAIVLTGGMAHDIKLVDRITERIGYLGRVEVVPGEREMISLARAAVRALRDESLVLRYSQEEV